MTSKRNAGKSARRHLPAFISKISPPQAGPRTVRRERLLQRLTGGSGPPIAIIRAPAGFGKTTLLLDIVRETSARVCWLSLDDWDREVLTFLGYLRSSVMRQLLPEALGTAIPRERDARAMLTGIAGAIESAEDDVLLVLDDFHCLDGAEEALDMVDHLLQRLPANCRLVLASRTAPPLRSLPRLRLIGRVVEVGPDDLSFTSGEIREYFGTVSGEAVSEAQIDDVMARTRGWPAAVVSLGSYRSSKREGDGRAEALSEYLAAEVLNRLPDVVQEFLVSTSVLEELSPEACDAVLGTDRAAQVLKALQMQNVPLVREQSAAGTSLRVHAVLREFLNEKLKSESPEMFRVLNRRAAEWFATCGRSGEGILHYTLAEDWALAADLLQREAPTAYKLGRWHAVASWLKLLPGAEVSSRPGLRAWEARILVRLGQPLEALRVVNEAMAGLSDGDAAVMAELEGIRSAAMRVKGDVATALSSARRSLALALEGNAPLQVLSDARLQLGLALVSEGSFAEAASELRSVLEMCELRGDDEEVAFVSGCLGSALGSAGKLPESVVYLEQARHQWQVIGNAKELSWVLNNLAMTYANMGQTERARELFTLALGKARDGENRRIEAYALDSLADIERWEGNLTEALALYENCLDICKQLGEMTLATLALTGLSDTHRRLGDSGRAETLARQVVASAKDRGGTLEEGLGLLALGNVARDTRRLDEAISSFSAATVVFENVDAKRELAEALLRLADALLPRRGNRPLVRQTLERLAEVGRTLGQDYSLRRAAASVPAVARYGVSRYIERDFYSQLLQATPGGTANEQEKQAPMPRTEAPFKVEVEALGSFACRVNGRSVQSLEWQSEKSRELFLLLLTADQPLRREEIIPALWPDIQRARGGNTFHATLHRLRRATHPECVLETGRRYVLNPAHTVVCDVSEFRKSYAKAEATDDPPSAIEYLRSCVSLYGGSFAPEVESEWAERLRMELEEQYVRCAQRLGGLLVEHRQYAEAVRVLERLLVMDPYSEDGCRLLMEALVGQNDCEGASRVYRRYARLLEQDLGEHPAPDIQRLYRLARAKGTEVS